MSVSPKIAKKMQNFKYPNKFTDLPCVIINHNNFGRVDKQSLINLVTRYLTVSELERILVFAKYPDIKPKRKKENLIKIVASYIKSSEFSFLLETLIREYIHSHFMKDLYVEPDYFVPLRFWCIRKVDVVSPLGFFNKLEDLIPVAAVPYKTMHPTYPIDVSSNEIDARFRMYNFMPDDILEMRSSLPLCINERQIQMIRSGKSGSKQYKYRLLMRFYVEKDIDKGIKLWDEFPDDLVVKLNGQDVSMPPALPSTDRPGVLKKRWPFPLDLTPYANLRVLYDTIQMEWKMHGTELFKKRYFFNLSLYKKNTCEELIDLLVQKGERFTKEDTLSKLGFSKDQEFYCDTMAMTITCPYTKTVMKLPARGVSCMHAGCFDATSYIQLNEVRPSWECCLCKQPCPFEDLRLDNFIMDIIKKEKPKPPMIKLMLKADGTYKLVSTKEPKTVKRDAEDSDSNDEVVSKPKKKVKKIEEVHLSSGDENEDYSDFSGGNYIFSCGGQVNSDGQIMSDNQNSDGTDGSRNTDSQESSSNCLISSPDCEVSVLPENHSSDLMTPELVHFHSWYNRVTDFVNNQHQQRNERSEQEKKKQTGEQEKKKQTGEQEKKKQTGEQEKKRPPIVITLD